MEPFADFSIEFTSMNDPDEYMNGFIIILKDGAVYECLSRNKVIFLDLLKRKE